MPKKEIDAAAYARLFEGAPDGPDILDDLMRRFCRPAKRTGGIDAVLETYHRDGARSVMEFIISRVNQANTGVIENDNDN